jgi:hypothetical protein
MLIRNQFLNISYSETWEDLWKNYRECLNFTWDVVSKLVPKLFLDMVWNLKKGMSNVQHGMLFPNLFQKLSKTSAKTFSGHGLEFEKGDVQCSTSDVESKPIPKHFL